MMLFTILLYTTLVHYTLNTTPTPHNTITSKHHTHNTTTRHHTTPHTSTTTHNTHNTTSPSHTTITTKHHTHNITTKHHTTPHTSTTTHNTHNTTSPSHTTITHHNLTHTPSNHAHNTIPSPHITSTSPYTSITPIITHYSPRKHITSTNNHHNFNLITQYQRPQIDTDITTPWVSKYSVTASQQDRTAENRTNNLTQLSNHSTPQENRTAKSKDDKTPWVSKYSITASQQDRTPKNIDTNTLISKHRRTPHRRIIKNNRIYKRSITGTPQGTTHLTAPQEGKIVTTEEGHRGRRRTRRRRKRKRRKGGRKQRGRRRIKGLALWIDENQVKMFSGYLMEIFVIHNSQVLPYILDPNFEKQLPVIPAQVSSVNFTWSSGSKKFQYTFEQAGTEEEEEEEEEVRVPTLSIPTQGTVPRKPTVFSVDISCSGNVSGTATFRIALVIHSPQGHTLVGTPLRLKLRKECRQKGPDPECDLKCRNGGVCDSEQQCQCPDGYMGQYCDTALCYPQCLNGGSCTTPGKCSCPPGFQGRHCEGGICQNKCKNGGKCVQKDRCKCRRGYFGNWCQYSQCFIACINGGKCRGVNKCRCPPGFAGDHCEVVQAPGDPAKAALPPDRCQRRCQYGKCEGGECRCHQGYTGRWCRRRSRKGGGGGDRRQRVWVR